MAAFRLKMKVPQQSPPQPTLEQTEVTDLNSKKIAQVFVSDLDIQCVKVVDSLDQSTLIIPVVLIVLLTTRQKFLISFQFRLQHINPVCKHLLIKHERQFIHPYTKHGSYNDVGAPHVFSCRLNIRVFILLKKKYEHKY